MTMTTTEWAVECGYIALITNAILDKHEEGKGEFQRKFDGDVERFRQFCRDKQRQAEAEGRHDSVVYIEHCLDDLKEVRTLFLLPDHPSDKPLTDHPHYQWLVDHEDTIDARHTQAMSQWLAEQGFDIKRHRLDPDQLTTLEYAHHQYLNLWMPTRKAHTLRELFIPLGTNHQGGYWLRDGKDMPSLLTDKVVPTEMLGNLIHLVDPIYPLSPAHYYFEVIKGTLFIKYQHIIGSRRLCVITEDLNHG